MQNIVHGDLKGVRFYLCLPSHLLTYFAQENVLITADCKACLADFGLACLISDISSISNSTTDNFGGSMRWMAPELFDGIHTCSIKSDIYAFGMMCIEVRHVHTETHIFFLHTTIKVFTGNVPFPQFKAVIVKVLEGARPPRPSTIVSDTLWSIVERCWKADSNARPTIRETLICFETAAEQFVPIFYLPRPITASVPLGQDAELSKLCESIGYG